MKLFEKTTYGTESTYYYILGRQVARKTDGCIYIGDWYTGWHSWKFDITYHTCGYDSVNAEFHISLLGWFSAFKLPWKSKKFPYGDCDEPTYGIMIHSNAVWLHIGGDGNMGTKRKWIAWNLPFTYSKPCCRWDVEVNYLDKGVLKTKMIPRGFMECRDNVNWKPIYEMNHVLINGTSYVLQVHNYDYTDSYDNTVIPCKYWVEEQEWRPKWLQWCPLFKRINRSIDIVFFGEVGPGKDEWKGGVTGCSYKLNDGETPRQCIERMEKERKFR